MLNILNLTKTNKLILAALAFLAVLAFGSGRAHAATLNVSGGCTLDEAITSVNNGSAEPGCTVGGYGTNDTINIPAGTVTLTADLPTITEDVVINGAGMGSTIISGDAGQYTPLLVQGATEVTITNMTITAYKSFAINVISTDVTLENIEVDGSDAVSSGEMLGIKTTNSDGNDHTVSSNNVYTHSLTAANQYTHAFVVSVYDGGHTTATITNTTLANVHVTGANGANGISMHVGTFGDNGGTMDVNISNTTVDDVTSEALTAPFNAVAFGSNGDATVNATIDNITITGTRGENGTGIISGIKSGAFYASTSGDGANDVGTVNMVVSNSLMADNLSSGVSSNCAAGDFTSILGGSGLGVPTITSAGYNISDDTSCVGFNQPGDQQNVSNILSTLGPLQDNGGPVPTRALLDGSPAISAGGAVLGVTTDARGIARPSTCPSVGAFQFEGAVCAASTTSGGSNAGAPNTGIKPSSSLVAIIATVAGLAGIGYAFRTRSRNYS